MKVVRTGPRWTQEEIDTGFGLLAEGVPLGEVALILGRSYNACYDRLERRKAAAIRRPPPKSAADDRLCLRCRKVFASRGPFNRICAACKDTPEWRDPDITHSARAKIRATALALLLLAAPAAAHQAPAGWEYDRECCDMQDCAQVADATIREVAGGYEVVIAPGQHPFVSVPVRAFVPHGSPKIRVSGDEHKHACVARHGYVYCIYVPPGGV